MIDFNTQYSVTADGGCYGRDATIWVQYDTTPDGVAGVFQDPNPNHLFHYMNAGYPAFFSVSSVDSYASGSHNDDLLAQVNVIDPPSIGDHKPNISISFINPSAYEKDYSMASQEQALSTYISTYVAWMFNITMDIQFPVGPSACVGSFARYTLGSDKPISRAISMNILAFVLTLMMPLFMHRVTQERGSGLLEMSQRMGLSMPIHWLASTFHDYTLYLVVYIVYMIVFLATVNPFAMVADVILYASHLLFGLTMLSMAYFWGMLFKSTRKSLIFGYVIVLVQVAISLIWTYMLTPPDSYGAPYLLWYPYESFFRIQFLITRHYANYIPVYPAYQLGMLLLIQAGGTLLMFLLCVVVAFLMPSVLGNRSSLFFRILDACRFCRKRGDDDNELDEVDDDDVVAERHVVADMVQSGDLANVVVNNVSKYYSEDLSKSFRALASVSFSIQEGECFGLLGPNGAGKTTLINILSGLISATHGEIYLDGKPSGKLSNVLHKIGLCGQDDIIWPDLTIESTLLYYARLKGVSIEKEAEVVTSVMDDVGLLDERRRLAGALSGGQRRRLSIAIGITSQPTILFLDEPSSGLDPMNRMGLWQVIQKLKKGRSILLTTHTMEEAEVLCSRIGILARGSLKCVGTQEHLKKKFGEGYKLTISSRTSQIMELHEYVTEIEPRATLVLSTESTYEYQLPKNVVLSEILSQLGQRRKEFEIQDIGLSRNSLEEVFLAIVKREEEVEATLMRDDIDLEVDGYHPVQDQV